MCLFAIQPMQVMVMGIERFCRSVVGINLRKLNWRRLSDLVPVVRYPSTYGTLSSLFKGYAMST